MPTHAPTKAPEEHHEHASGGHEHPAAYTPRPLVAARDLALLRAALERACATECGAPLFAAVDAIERTAECARRYCLGDLEAGPPMEASISVLAPAITSGVHIHSDGTAHDHGKPDVHTTSHKHEAVTSSPDVELSLSWLVDVMGALTLWTCGDRKRVKALAEPVVTMAAHVAGWAEILLRTASAKENAGTGALLSYARAMQCGCSSDAISIELAAPSAAFVPKGSFASALAVRMRALVDEWIEANPYQRHFELVEAGLPRLATDALEIDAGAELSLVPASGEFAATLKEGVFFGASKEPAKVVSSSRRELRVVVPDGDGSTIVRLARLEPEDRGALDAMQKEWTERLGDDWSHTLLSLFAFYGWPRHRGDSAVVAIRPRPSVELLALTDANGRVIEEAKDVGPGARLHWRVRGGEKAAQLELALGGVVLRGAPRDPSGYGSFDIDDEVRTGGVENVDARFGPINIPIWPRPVEFLSLEIDPKIVRLLVPSNWDAADATHRAPPVGVTIKSPRRFPVDVTLRVSSSDTDRFVVQDESVVLRAGTDEVTVLVRGSSYGAPREAAAMLDVSLRQGRVYATASAEVWIEPAQGRWISRGVLGIVAVHAALFPSGKVLFFSPSREFDAAGNVATDSAGNAIWNLGHRFVEIEVWDSRTGALTRSPMSPSAPTRNLFCAGHCHLPDGTLFLAGGHNNFPEANPADRHLHVFDPEQASGSAWTRFSPEMRRGRWYPTCTVMSDGRVLIVSGANLPFAPILGGSFNFTEIFGYGANTRLEVFDPTRGGLVAITTDTFLDDRWMGTYPHVFVVPKGEGTPAGAVLALERERMHIFRYAADESEPLRRTATHFASGRSIRTFPTYGSAVLLPIRADIPRVQVLIVGGGNEERTSVSKSAAATDTAELFTYDLSRAPEDQRSPFGNTLRMRNRRFLSDATLLPDGTVLITGGAAVGYTNENSVAVLEAELFLPINNTFRAMMPARVERRYHSIALLLPDATVLSAGSTGAFAPGVVAPQFEMEAFQPPYLWRGPAPVAIGTLPSSAAYDSVLRVDYDPTMPAPQRAMLMKLGSVTHANNMDQRCVELVRTGAGATMGSSTTRYVDFRLPPDGTFAPPGHYMLFLVDAWGVPSDGHMLRIE